MAQAPTVGFGCSVQGLDPALLGLFYTGISNRSGAPRPIFYVFFHRSGALGSRGSGGVVKSEKSGASKK